MDKASSEPSAHVLATPLTVIMQAIAARLDIPQIFNIVAQQAEHILAHNILAVLLCPDARAARGKCQNSGHDHEIWPNGKRLHACEAAERGLFRAACPEF